MLFVIIGTFVICSGVASALTTAAPGSIIPLQLNGYQMQTSGLVITPSWRPAFVKWYLIDPSGNTKYMVQNDLDSVQQISSGFNSATWSINENSGTMKIPAFAQKGTWQVRGKIYDVNKAFIIQWSNKAEFTSQTIYVGDYSVLDNFMGPAYTVYINLGGNPLTGELEFSFAFPDLVYIVAFIIILFLIIINVMAYRSRRKINA